MVQLRKAQLTYSVPPHGNHACIMKSERFLINRKINELVKNKKNKQDISYRARCPDVSTWSQLGHLSENHLALMSRVLSLCKYITCGHLLPFSPSSVWVWDQPGGERQRDQLCEYQTCSVMHWPRTWTGFSFSARVNPQWLLQFLTVWRRFMKSCSTRTPMSYRRNMREAALACCAVVFLHSCLTE